MLPRTSRCGNLKSNLHVKHCRFEVTRGVLKLEWAWGVDSSILGYQCVSQTIKNPEEIISVCSGFYIAWLSEVVSGGSEDVRHSLSSAIREDTCACAGTDLSR